MIIVAGNMRRVIAGDLSKEDEPGVVSESHHCGAAQTWWESRGSRERYSFEHP